MNLPLRVRLATAGERMQAIARLRAQWGDPVIVRGSDYCFHDCDIYIAGDFAGLAAVCQRDRPVAELVAINAFERGGGIGSALIEAIVARLEGFHSLRLATTNDNLDALRFYQRRDFRLVALRPGAVDGARRLKPSIPEIGDYGIPVRDELDLMLSLTQAD